ncbi:hypothetical protein [Desulfopila sp. IMCC35008]|uniref:hypothetical protein n=1 Tax=Desulfopila sp. IMCC35008 TaxID=2653858 RepID=UPI002714AFC1|nr:hypothetical protein [Desulfopila sp. IMCC35008]
MTGEEMLVLINQLSSSGTVQSFTSNYGIGAKIAAATRNPHGVIYQSWKDSEGAMIQLEKDPETGEYGLHQWELEDGTFSHYIQLDDDIKPAEIDQHGTKVILLGNSDFESTIEAPSNAVSPSRWISKYLNTRYFKFPDNIKIKAREGWTSPRTDSDRNVLRALIGQKSYLDSHAVTSGVKRLETANVHWWILKDEKSISCNSGYIESAGHVAALYQNELYDRLTARAGVARLQLFGVLFGMRHVVLYAEPLAINGNALTTNTARTALLLNGEELPWADWAFEFRKDMPKELVDFISKKSAAGTEKDHVKSIKERLKGIMDLYKVSRYMPKPHGDYLSDTSSSVKVGLAPGSGTESKGGKGSGNRVGNSSKGPRDGEVGNIYHLFQKRDGVQCDKTNSDPFPIVKWVSIEDGTRDENDIEDKAAKYLQDQNTLMINADFRVFKDMTARLCREKEFTEGINLQRVIEDIVHGWFEQALNNPRL